MNYYVPIRTAESGRGVIMTKKNKKLSALFILGCLGIIVVVGAVVFVATGGMKDSNEMLSGVKIGGIEVGGLTEEEAEGKVNEYLDKLQNRQVTINIGEEQLQTTASLLGYSCDAKDTVERAYKLGKSGNFLSRFTAIGKIENKDKEFPLESAVDETILRSFLEENCTKYDVKAKNSKLKLVNGKFKATKSRTGMELQLEDTMTVIKSALLKDTSGENMDVTAVVKVTKAKYTKEQVEKCKDLLGSYSTSYSTSTAARATNVRVAANYINGSIIYPGKTFSVVKTIKDRTIENGYQSAAEYSSGKVVDGIGGGVCQVSTTLYNAVINAELEIVERSPHSMVVAYVDVSRDAAIAGDYKDFKFKNNTDVPVYIAATADGSTLSFRIYGEETRPSNRKIKFESETLETIQPGEPKIEEDPTKPASYRVVTQSAHVGYKARLWKIIYIDDKETDRVQINSSVYSAEPEHITVGKQATTPTPSPSASAEPKNSAKPKVSKKPKATKKPQVTKAPQATKKPQATKEPVVTEKPLETEPPVE